MIEQQTIETGTIVKTHGVNGELIIETNSPAYFENIKEPVFLKIDGLLVPFFIKSSHVISQQRVRVLFDCTTTEPKAKKLVGLIVFITVNSMEEEEDEFIPSPDEIIDFEVIDKKYGNLGLVKQVINQHTNPVMFVEKNKQEILIPFHPEFIRKINFKKKQINVITPEGLINLYTV
jgi:16S rRNA processing protein RimM